MKICKTIVEIRAFVHQQRKNGHSIGFVPTMGALHEGHIDLVAASNKNVTLLWQVFLLIQHNSIILPT